jgi:hypothetical protein
MSHTNSLYLAGSWTRFCLATVTAAIAQLRSRSRSTAASQCFSHHRGRGHAAPQNSHRLSWNSWKLPSHPQQVTQHELVDRCILSTLNACACACVTERLRLRQLNRFSCIIAQL